MYVRCVHFLTHLLDSLVGNRTWVCLWAIGPESVYTSHCAEKLNSSSSHPHHPHPHPTLSVGYLFCFGVFLSEVMHTEKQVAPKAAFSGQFFRLLSITILLGSQKLSFLALVKACIVSTINKWCHDVLFDHSGTLYPLLRCAVFHFQERTLF